MQQIFISYSQKNSEIAEKLEDELKDQNPKFKIWRDKPSIKLGTHTYNEIDHALMNSDIILGIITKEYLESRNAMQEAYYAIKYQKFIPLFFESRKPLSGQFKA